ncbi:NitT/TauT family transport system ATP-binding protein [Marinilactibacillus piezotolerans]|uniref:NitT/TauT family transport system ATP-binding protein n=1 Tax=Marinilactibacillus piezotolerans TaxID=258723 RepID=A0A1I3XKX6_9LACT|nr:ATP-binding cassette domain-containing protein [Marinilactibacillus piezotolerans]SFK20172.1 NitT/TauT family transport system ATP-binding protein [Marinilactibacillus piezotolerans]
MGIIIKNLNFIYEQNQIFKNTDFHFEDNKIYTLVGPSGIGKSTLLDVLTGFKKPQSGTISYQNVQKSEMLTIFQNNQIFPWLTVSEALALPFKIKNISKEQTDSRVKELLKIFELEALAYKRPNALSGGQLQRVAIAQGLTLDPKFLLLDEPTSSLDQEAKEEIQDRLLDEQHKRNNTMIIVTHDIEEAAYLGQEIILVANQQLNKLENPTFGRENRRHSLGFYEFCILLRKQVRQL